MITITITKHSSVSWRVATSEIRGQSVKYAKQNDHGEAAALALDFARDHGEYVIVGPAAVMDLIPEQLRSKGLR